MSRWDDRAGNRQRMCFTDSVRDLGEQTVLIAFAFRELLSQAVSSSNQSASDNGMAP